MAKYLSFSYSKNHGNKLKVRDLFGEHDFTSEQFCKRKEQKLSAQFTSSVAVGERKRKYAANEIDKLNGDSGNFRCFKITLN